VAQEMHQMLDHPTGGSRAMALLHRLRLLHCILPEPLPGALETILPVGILEGVAGGGVLGSADNGATAFFNIYNMPDSAVNLVIASHLLTPPGPDAASLSDEEKRSRRLLRYGRVLSATVLGQCAMQYRC
jgi:hypothetical protein